MISYGQPQCYRHGFPNCYFTGRIRSGFRSNVYRGGSVHCLVVRWFVAGATITRSRTINTVTQTVTATSNEHYAGIKHRASIRSWDPGDGVHGQLHRPTDPFDPARIDQARSWRLRSNAWSSNRRCVCPILCRDGDPDCAMGRANAQAPTPSTRAGSHLA